MANPTVSNTITRPGTGVAPALVTVFLAGENGDYVVGYLSDGTTIEGVKRVVVDVAAGVWSLEMVPNAQITPAGTVYRFIERVDGRTNDVFGIVPDVADAEYGLWEIVTDPPGSIEPTDLALERAARIAGDADLQDQIDGLGGGGGGAVDSVNGRTGVVVGLAEQSALTAEAALARNADNLTSGTVADARVAATIARDSEVAAAVAAEATLARNGDNITSGTVADARIASTIARDTEVTAAVAAEAALARNADNLTGGTVADARIASTIARDTEVTNAVAAEAIARSAEISAAIAALIASAPGLLDTLDEIAAALGDDPNFAATMTTALAGKQPIDSDLTAIAALATTAYGRAFLELATAAAGRTALGLGTAAVVDTGTGASNAILGNDARLTDSRAPSGAAGGVLGGTYPNPSFAADMATQAELDAVGAAKIDKSTLDANTILYATTDDTPAALAVAASRFVGRKATGDVAAMTAAEARTLLGLTDEEIQDLIGAMVTGGTETGITVTYDDTNARFDFVVSGGSVATDTIWDAAGDLAVGTGADTAAKLALGAVGQAPTSQGATNGLVYDSPRGSRDFALKRTGSIAETIHRNATMGGAAVLVSQRVSVVAIPLVKGDVITSISFLAGGTGAGTPLNQQFGLYDTSLNRLRVTTDDTTTAWVANTVKTLNLTSTYTVPASGVYYLAILVVATTVPNLISPTGLSTVATALAPILTATSSTGVTALPDPIGALTSVGNYPYAYCS